MLEQEAAKVSQTKTDEELYPAVHRAYDFVLPSYQFMLSRFEAADTRLTSILTIASSLTLAAPLFGRSVNPNLAFRGWFTVGIALFVFLVGLALWARFTGRLTLPNPRVLHDESLRESEWEFKKNAIYFAGKHFDQNAKAIATKAYLAMVLTILAILEIGAFLAWAVW